MKTAKEFLADLPRYRFRFEVIDDVTDETVITDWTSFDIEQIGAFGDCSTIDIHVGCALRALRRRAIEAD